MQEVRCVCCDRLVGVGEDWGAYNCTDCAEKYPSSLVKACSDPFSYAIGLRGGIILEFHKAKVKGDWVTIYPTDSNKGWEDESIPGHFTCPRGIDIRLSEIIWCVDAPCGS